MALMGRDYLEILTLIAPIDYWLRLVVFVSVLFEIDIKLKRYEGGLVHFDGSTSHIDLVRFRPMIRGSASLFGRLSVSFGTEARRTER